MSPHRPLSGKVVPAPVHAPLERLLTLPEVAALARVSPRTVQRQISGGRLIAVKVGRQLRFHRGQVEAWMSQGLVS
jgi:excisionase family DNA binding protein